MNVLKYISFPQIGALLKVFFLVRLRQPWMTILQYLWPCMMFFMLFPLRSRFKAVEVDKCQFPTRQLPSNEVIPFFQSYICTLRNECTSPDVYEETAQYSSAPLAPILQMVQLFLSEKDLYDAVIDLPTSMNFLGTVITISTHKKFSLLKEYLGNLQEKLPTLKKIIGFYFDVDKLFSDSGTFADLGSILCGKPFPRRHNIRFVNRIIYDSKDYNGADKNELEVLPSQYCRQVYLDVTTGSNSGKITWHHVKPILHGKILYGPDTPRNMELIKFANRTFHDMGRLRQFFATLNTTINMITTDEKMKSSFNSLREIVDSPLVAAMLNGNEDKLKIMSILDAIENSQDVKKVANVVASILECFSVDRFMPVKSEKELEDTAHKLGEKKLFYAGIYFDDNLSPENVTYKLRMDIDDTPKTIENRNRFWFPGSESSFEFDMRYHRGFIQIQQVVDLAIIRFEKKQKLDKQFPKPTSEATTKSSLFGWNFNSFDSDEDEDDDSEETDSLTTTSTAEVPSKNEEATTEPVFDVSSTESLVEGSGGHDIKKRSPQLDTIFSFLRGGSQRLKTAEDSIEVDKLKFYTKQFPYPKYTWDTFKKGVYLAQAIQMCFFFGLMVVIASTIRQRIWMKESGNIALMRVMGLKKSSEYLAWVATAFIELAIVFMLCLIILYTGDLLVSSNQLFIYCYLLFFGTCIIAFCYMTSTFFSSASIGSVAGVVFFLTTFLPYIVIISLGTTLSSIGKFVVNLSFSTAFCYSWRHIMRTELQLKELSFGNAFTGDLEDNDLLFGTLMILFDLCLYIAIGYLCERFLHDDNTFYEVGRKKLGRDVGGQLVNVSKTYDDNRYALKNVSVEFKRDEITCLLGRNGAGKSTTIKLLTGQILPTSGEISLPPNYDLISGITNYQEKVGLCSQNNVLIPNLTAKEHLNLYAKIKMRGHYRSEVRRILKTLQLGRYESFKCQELSGGFKRRLCIAIAFLGSPNLVILDEPCSGVDMRARKNIWELIELLRVGRSVVLATHYLDEAEQLSDKVLILRDGEIYSQTTPKDLKEIFTNNFLLKVTFDKYLEDEEEGNLIENFLNILKNQISDFDVLLKTSTEIQLKIKYLNEGKEYYDFEPVIHSLETMQEQHSIKSFSIISKNLEGIFNEANKASTEVYTNGVEINITPEHVLRNGSDQKKPSPMLIDMELSIWDVIWSLLWKRFVHFKRNYRLLLTILVLPTIFEIIAMGFMKLRPPGEYDNKLLLSKMLYNNSTEFYGYGNDPNASEFKFERSVYEQLVSECGTDCKQFNDTGAVFHWLLDTHDDYLMKRYGGVTFNEDKNIVWYNNKGYHSMAAYLNHLNSALFKVEMNDSSRNIITYNHPLKLSSEELSYSSILQQVADAGISLILLVAFSLVLAGASVYVVNERVSGEKLQQKLCGVGFQTYWGVTFLWDFVIYSIAVLLAVGVFKTFNIPVYVAQDNLDGIVLLLMLYGFATIPMIHCVEKLFVDASFANMSIFCLNVIVALSTISTVMLVDILGDSNGAEKFRDTLNRIFLVLPQHAFADGLIVICKNYIQSEVFKRYYINPYVSPITGDLLTWNYTSLVICGIVFMILNYLIESGYLRQLVDCVRKGKTSDYEMKLTSQSSVLKREEKLDFYPLTYALKVDGLSKTYDGNDYAVSDVTFGVQKGECFGLLGANGAGKSTIFAILSGQIVPTMGSVEYFDNSGISFCPQTNPLDPLLTVTEVIQFYGKLRRVIDVEDLLKKTLSDFHLEPYKNVLVKNLSGGNQRKLTVAVTTFGDTSTILMDEPTSDMDPVTRALVYKVIDDLTSCNRAVVLTSHTISEIERVCNRIMVLHFGRVISTGTPADLKLTYGNCYSITIFCDREIKEDLRYKIEAQFPNVHNLIIHNHSIQFMMKIKSVKSVVKVPNNNNVTIDEVTATNDRIYLSELYKKLHRFCVTNKLAYTMSECLLDQVFESILDTNDLSFINLAYLQSESELCN